MDMCYDGALVMPSSYAVMSEDEMTYVEGGSHNVILSKKFLNKNNCLAEAGRLIHRQMVVRMTQQQIAKEIYAHAVTKYVFEALPKWVREMPVARDVYRSASDGAYIADGGDTGKRQAFYNTVWKIL
ncbi:MAG: hypothetical protein PUC12_03780 [Clostridiales bacterium]|nr:hypothetical protein [Clostridiales bacterium]